MSLTLVVEENASLRTSDVGVDRSSASPFCSVCFTDHVAVLDTGAVYCAECGHLSSSAQGSL